MSRNRSRIEALERRIEGQGANPLLKGFPTDPEERTELLTRIRAQDEEIRKGGGQVREERVLC